MREAGRDVRRMAHSPEVDQRKFAAGVQDAVVTEGRDAVAAGRRPTEAGAWFQSDVRRLHFDADGVDYSVAVDV